MRTDELDFELPAELIAQMPAERRGEREPVAERGRVEGLAGLLPGAELLVGNDGAQA